MLESPAEPPRYTWAQKKQALARQIAPYRRTLIGLSILGIFSAIANGTVPLLVGRFLDSLLNGKQFELNVVGTVPLWTVMLGLWVCAQVVAICTDWLISRNSSRITTELQAGYQAHAFSHALTLPISFHKHHRSGEISEIINRASWMLESMAGAFITFAPALLSIIIGIVIALWLKPVLAAVLLAGLTLYLLLLARMLRPIAKIQERAGKEWGEAFGDAYDAYANIATVKHASAEEYERDRIAKRYYEGAIPLWYKLETIWSSITYSQRVVILCTQITIFGLSVYLVQAGQLTIGELIAFNSYAGMIFGPFVQIGRQWQQIQNGLVNIVRGEIIFGTDPEAYTLAGAPDLSQMRGEVRFNDVHFAYEPTHSEVLRGVSFTAAPGSTVALVGETGAGKSTIADLISGYYFPTAGQVRLDGHDITTLSLSQVRRHIAVVPQEVVLFNAPIADNIRYGRPDATDDEVREAARKAHADAFIQKFQKGYAQEVGERGVKLSVGQKQRIAIARAILRDPKILILDEPTSALDAETERYISASLDALMQGRTTFIIAHRLSTVRKADLILVLKDGVIAERGTHADLMAIEGGVYRHLYELHIGLYE